MTALRKPDRSALLLCAMMALVPALGFPTEELLQDTFKSILVALFALGGTWAFFWQQRKQPTPLLLHAILAAPLALMVYALISTAWSHTYLAGVEAIRWFLFSLILFLGLNTLTQIRITHLAWGIHIGAVVASLWAALQFWIDFSWFAQGPNPASTFVNRNFFGEFIVCTIPFSVLLLTRVQDKATVFALAFSLAFNIVALMQTGTRSGLVSMLVLLLVLPLIVMRYRQHIVSRSWRLAHCVALGAFMLGTVGALGAIPTTNNKIIVETGPGNAIDRALTRTASIAKPKEYSEGSFAIRARMWKASWRMIQSHPLTGVGAGAWEVNVPLYQQAGNHLETDYYAHNEPLQLLAEYGLTGGLFLVCILGYMVWVAVVTWRCPPKSSPQEMLPRALTLSSLLVLLLVSNAGFPWRMATTGALFAICLSILAASDVRMGLENGTFWRAVAVGKKFPNWALAACASCTALALYISQQAIECESKLVRAVKISITISNSGIPNDPRWADLKSDMVQLLQEGVRINPHYRKMTPIAGDALANWGDWKNAIWVWESVSESRPYVGALLTNIARAYIQEKDYVKARDYLDRALKLQPDSLALKGLEMTLWMRTGKTIEAGKRARELLQEKDPPMELVRTAYYLGMQNRDAPLAIEAMTTRIKLWPEQAVDSWLKLGLIYAAPEVNDEAKAIQSYQAAVDATPRNHMDEIRSKIPPRYLSKLHETTTKN